MNKVENKDFASDTFLEVSKKVDSQIPEILLKNIYNSLLTHQFDRDAASSLQEIKQLVNEYIEKNPKKEIGDKQ